MQESIVILGGGEDQTEAYRRSREMGYRVIGVDENPDCLGSKLADRFLAITTRDPERIADQLDGERVVAVISPASDAAQESVAALSDKLGTPQLLSRTALRATVDKGFFHEVTASLGLSRYHHFESADRSAVVAAAAKMRFPVVVKPSDSSGSKGLTCARGPEDLPAAVDHAAGVSPSGVVIVEEYLEGRHLSAECFLSGGQVALLCITERDLTESPHMITVTHTLPGAGPGLTSRIGDLILRICVAMDHRNGPVNFDLVLTPDGRIVFIEVGARLGGNGMPMLVRHAFGIDTVTAALQCALGQPPQLRATRNRVAMLHILTADRDGVLQGFMDLSGARALPEVEELVVFKAPGDDVHRYTQARHKLGYLVLTADSRTELARARARALGLISPTLSTPTLVRT